MYTLYRHIEVHLPDAADGQRRVVDIGRPLYAASAALCMRTKAHEAADHTATGHVQQLSHSFYIRMPRTTVTMSLRADWLYLEVFYSHLI